MKKNNKNKIFKIVFLVFFISFLVVYFSELTGYYEFQNHKQATLTKEQVKKFEADISSGKEVDLQNYLTVEKVNYNNNLSKLASKLSSGISDIVKGGVETMFRYLSKMVEE